MVHCVDGGRAADNSIQHVRLRSTGLPVMPGAAQLQLAPPSESLSEQPATAVAGCTHDFHVAVERLDKTSGPVIAGASATAGRSGNVARSLVGPSPSLCSPDDASG